MKMILITIVQSLGNVHRTSKPMLGIGKILRGLAALEEGLNLVP